MTGSGESAISREPAGDGASGAGSWDDRVTPVRGAGASEDGFGGLPRANGDMAAVPEEGPEGSPSVPGDEAASVPKAGEGADGAAGADGSFGQDAAGAEGGLSGEAGDGASPFADDEAPVDGDVGDGSPTDDLADLGPSSGGPSDFASGGDSLAAGGSPGGAQGSFGGLGGFGGSGGATGQAGWFGGGSPSGYSGWGGYGNEGGGGWSGGLDSPSQAGYAGGSGSSSAMGSSPDLGSTSPGAQGGYGQSAPGGLGGGRGAFSKAQGGSNPFGSGGFGGSPSQGNLGGFGGSGASGGSSPFGSGGFGGSPSQGNLGGFGNPEADSGASPSGDAASPAGDGPLGEGGPSLGDAAGAGGGSNNPGGASGDGALPGSGGDSLSGDPVSVPKANPADGGSSSASSGGQGGLGTGSGAPLAGQGASGAGLGAGAGTGAGLGAGLGAGAGTGAAAGGFSAVGSGILSALSAHGISLVAVVGSGIATAMAIVSLALGMALVPDSSVYAVSQMAGEECGEDVDAAAVDEVSDSEIEKHHLENLKKVNSVLQVMGFDNTHISAVLGRWEYESGSMDPTAIEGVDDMGEGEPYVFGPEKQAKAGTDEALTEWTQYYLTHYTLPDSTFNVPAYRDDKDPNRWSVGLGLCQWTGPGGYELRDHAKALGKDWYDFDYQLAFALAKPPTGRGTEWWDKFKNRQFSSIYEAQDVFTAEYEGVPGMRVDDATAISEDFSKKIDSWEVDRSYAQSIIKMIEAETDRATETAVDEAKEECEARQKCVDVTGAAQAMAAFAEPNLEAARGTDGTELYQNVCMSIDGTLAACRACDQGVRMAVMWSGTDIEYPRETGTQHAYLMSSPKWELVESDVRDTDKLQPGDVLVTQTKGHTLMYTGHEVLEEKFGNQIGDDIDFCHAGLLTDYSRSWPPAVPPTTLTEFLNTPYELTRHYDAFRCVKPDNSDKYASAGALPAATTMCSDSAEEEGEEVATEDGAKIVQAAKEVTYCEPGMCAAYVSRVYQKALGFYPDGNACDMYARVNLTDKKDLEPGMIVAVSKHSGTQMGAIFGHVGIYIGDGKVMDNIGYIRTIDIDDWIDYYSSLVQPHFGYLTG